MTAQGRFLTGSTMGHVVRMTATGAAGLTFVFAVDAANLFWIAQLDRPVLMAAIGYAFAIQFFSVSIGVGMMIGTTVLVSRSIGAGQRAQARQQGSAGLVLTIMVQTITAVCVVSARVPLLESLNASGEVLQLAARYLAMTVPSLVLMAVGLSGSALLRAEGDGRRAMFVTLTGGTVMMLIDPVLIVVFGLGLDGAALGLWLFRAVMAITALYYVTQVHDLLARPSLEAVRQTAWPLAMVAAPAIATQMAAPAGNYLLTRVIADFGDAAVGAWAVVNRLTVVAFGGLFALSGAIGGIFGQNFGAGQYDRLVSTYRNALIFCVCYAMAVWAVLMLLSGGIADGFEVPQAGRPVLRAYTHLGAGAFAVAGAIFVANAAFNTLGRPLRASCLSWLKEGILVMPVAIWMSGVLGAVGVVYAQAVVGVVMGLLAGGWGWIYVQSLQNGPRPKVDLTTRRAWRDVNRYRRR